MYTVLLILFIPICLALIAIVLLQVGKGAGFAGAFGAGGGTQTVFGARAGTFLTKLTTWLAALFMILALAMAVLSAKARPGAGGPKPAPVEQTGQPEQAELPEQPELPERAPAETE
jgi:preprotein translocase subunit SecG